MIYDEIFYLKPDNVNISEYRDFRLYFNYLVKTPEKEELYFDIQ
jgi:hypothetical protein